MVVITHPGKAAGRCG